MTQMPEAAPMDQPTDQKAKTAGMVMGAGALIALISLFMTWVTVSLDLSGFPGGASFPSKSENGIGTSDGKLTLVLAIVLLVFAVQFVMARVTKPKVLAVIGIILAAIITVAAVIDVTTTEGDAREEFLKGFRATAGAAGSQFAEQFADRLDVKVGAGLYATAAGGALAFIGSIMALGVKEPEPGYAMAPPMPPGETMMPPPMPPPITGTMSPPMGGAMGGPMSPPGVPPPGTGGTPAETEQTPPEQPWGGTAQPPPPPPLA